MRNSGMIGGNGAGGGGGLKPMNDGMGRGPEPGFPNHGVTKIGSTNPGI